MGIFKIKDDIFFVGVKDWERKLFDEIIPLPDGTSYNSYLIKGSQKVALIDGVDPTKEDFFIKNLMDLGLKIDYVISNHAEQDHSGAIPKILSIFPEAKVLTNEKCKEFLKDLLLIPEEKFILVKDKEELSLGNKTLKFFMTPWVHWPETMITYLVEDKILFPCDFFGSHFADVKIIENGNEIVKESAKRYYAEIMMPFRNSIIKHLKLLEEIEIEILAPSHGFIYKNPDFIINCYKEWVSDELKNQVIILYVSMHGSVLEMINILEREFIKNGISYKRFNSTNCDIGEFAMALIETPTIVIGTPVFLSNIHPNVLNFLNLTNALRPKLKYGLILSSFSWGQRIEEQIRNSLSNCKIDFIGTVISKGFPEEEEINKIKENVKEILKKHNEDGLIKK